MLRTACIDKPFHFPLHLFPIHYLDPWRGVVREGVAHARIRTFEVRRFSELDTSGEAAVVCLDDRTRRAHQLIFTSADSFPLNDSSVSRAGRRSRLKVFQVDGRLPTYLTRDIGRVDVYRVANDAVADASPDSGRSMRFRSRCRVARLRDNDKFTVSHNREPHNFGLVTAHSPSGTALLGQPPRIPPPFSLSIL